VARRRERDARDDVPAPSADPPTPALLPAREAVRFRSRVWMGFPASDVFSVERAKKKEAAAGVGTDEEQEADAPYEVTVDFMGLAGVTGPLPRPLTELVMARSARGDHAAREFLDLFNHRLVSLLCAARRKHRPALCTGAAEETALAGELFALLGLGTPGLRGRLEAKGVPDAALLTYAGLLAHRPRSLAGLETLLSDYFGVRVRGAELKGRWYAMDEEDRTRIGAAAGANHALGRGAALGGRVWDQQAAFELELGPLSRAQFLDCLPTGTAYAPLCALVRFWVGVDLEFTLRLAVRAGDVSGTKLADAGCRDAGGARLGWTSWLKTTPSRADDRQVVLGEHARVPETPTRKLRAPLFFRG
jgi:type VI secretion system protein ImpH